MSKENQSYLRFSLEESIWFQKGQEVAELYSISLEPNVTIQENDQYVVIKGTLDLSGEYKEEERNGESEIKNYIQNYHPKTIQEVDRGEDGLNEFFHRFPVDITIPYNRINSLQDVDVEIQTFDYVLPEKNCLKLQADLLITGIYREKQAETAEHEEENDLEYEYKQSEEYSYENYVGEYPRHEDHVPHRFEYEESLADSDAELISRQEEPVGESAAPEDLESGREYLQVDEPYQAGIERPASKESPAGERDDEELYSPFFAEAKKFPEEEREEETEPTLVSKQPEIPVFEIPLEPLYQELKTKMPEWQKEPETAHPKADTKPGSFYIEEDPESGAAKVVQEEQKPDEIDREPVQAEHQPVKEEPIYDPVQAGQEAVQEEPIQVSNRTEQEAVQEKPVHNSSWAEQKPIKEEPVQASVQAEQEQIQDDYSPILNLVKKVDRPSVQNKSRKGNSSANKEKERPDEKDDEQLSLMDFFGRKQEEELTKVKVCIVQHGDTLTTLAERYEVNVQSLLIRNGFDQSHDVFEGQVLYIPKAMSFK
ncbi:stage VI sporulation protein D [Peribacillus cavernae]|uniref:stage VI sporulation protein D n=1 Tax=Peribacillus cavernae TaxID=1674310 RepID=UPI00163C1AE5|nr:stage VI sporulation protein D [Peribacillus cavernae]MDQ0219390.1 stage VI sporulation protein D [Peribacillus cavernae]